MTTVRQRVEALPPGQYAVAAKKVAELASDLYGALGVEVDARTRRILDATIPELEDEQRRRLARLRR